MASQRQHRSRLAARLCRLRSALAHVSMIAGAAAALGGAVPASASVPAERHVLEARVKAVRAALNDDHDAADAGAGVEPSVRTAQWFNWGNWNNWNNWKNWLNQ